MDDGPRTVVCRLLSVVFIDDSFRFMVSSARLNQPNGWNMAVSKE
jgi:hypothetical protein